MDDDQENDLSNPQLIVASPLLDVKRSSEFKSGKKVIHNVTPMNREALSGSKNTSSSGEKHAKVSGSEVHVTPRSRLSFQKKKETDSSSSSPASHSMNDKKKVKVGTSRDHQLSSGAACSPKATQLSGGFSGRIRTSLVSFNLAPYKLPSDSGNFIEMNPGFTLHTSTTSQQLQRMTQEYNALEVATQDSRQVNFSTSSAFEHLNRYCNVGANEDTLFPPCAPSAVPTLDGSSTEKVKNDTQIEGKQTSRRSSSFYINANYMHVGLPKNQMFVASQAPIPQGFLHFYGTLMQYGISLIFMLAKEKEGLVPKADAYWPPETASIGNPHAVGPYRLWYDSEGVEKPLCKDEKLKLIYRKFVIQKESDFEFNKQLLGKKNSSGSTETETPKARLQKNPLLRSPHKVELIQYVGWPDHGVPSSSSAFKSLLSRIEQYFYGTPSNGQEILEVSKLSLSDNDGTTTGSGSSSPPFASAVSSSVPPILIHCSAGLGRTATLIGAYAAIYRARQGTLNDRSITEIVTQMRRCRFGSIQRVEQYMFIYEVVMGFMGIDVTELSKEIVKKSEAFQMMNPKRF